MKTLTALILLISSANAGAQETLAPGPTEIRSVQSLSELQGSWTKIGYGCLDIRNQNIRSIELSSERIADQRITFKGDRFEEVIHTSRGECVGYQGSGSVRTSAAVTSGLMMQFALTAEAQFNPDCLRVGIFGASTKIATAYLLNDKYLVTVMPNGWPRSCENTPDSVTAVFYVPPQLF